MRICSLLIILTAFAATHAVLLSAPRFSLQYITATSKEYLMIDKILYSISIHLQKPYEFFQLNFQNLVEKIPPTTDDDLLAKELEEVITDVISKETVDVPVNTTKKTDPMPEKSRQHRKTGIDKCLQDMQDLITAANIALFNNIRCRLNDNKATKSSICSNEQLGLSNQPAKILDAWGRPPSGLYSSGPYFWLGSYDQCMDMLNSTNSLKYCVANILANEINSPQRISLHYGMCLPAKCDKLHMETIISKASEVLQKTLHISISPETSVDCQNEKISLISHFGIAQWILVIILVVLCLLVLAGTITDIYVTHRSRAYNVHEVQTVTLLRARRMGSTSRSVASHNSFVHDDYGSAIFSDAPSHALTYKSVPAVKKTFSKKRSLFYLIRAFSLRSTFRYLMRPSYQQLQSLHGIRVLSAFWVVTGHSHLLSLEYLGNARQLWEKFNGFGFITQIIFNSSLAVDSFFLLSGTVLAYTVQSRIKRRQFASKVGLSFTSWILFYCHRIVRLMPTYALTFALIYYMFQYIGNGPMWSQENGVFGARCNDHDWWHHLLFVTNFFPNECMPWMWYLSLDTQFHIIAPIILTVMHVAPLTGVAIVIAGIIISVLYRIIANILLKLPTTLLLAVVENESLATTTLEKMFIYYYAAPQARIAPFLIGIVLGWFLAGKQSCHLPLVQLDVLRAVSFILLSTSLFGAHYADNQNTYSLLYSAVFRLFWSIGLAILIWLCERGYLRRLQVLFAWKKWVPFSRLSFGFYMAHEPVLLYLIWTRRSSINASSPMFFLWMAIKASIIAIFFALLIAIIIEIPPITIERKIFKKIRSRIANKKKEESLGDHDPEEITDNDSAVLLQNEKEERARKLNLPAVPAFERTEFWIEKHHSECPSDGDEEPKSQPNNFENPEASSVSVKSKNKDEYSHSVGKTLSESTKISENCDNATIYTPEIFLKSKENTSLSTVKSANVTKALPIREEPEMEYAFPKRDSMSQASRYVEPKKEPSTARQQFMHRYELLIGKPNTSKGQTDSSGRTDSFGFSWISDMERELKAESEAEKRPSTEFIPLTKRPLWNQPKRLAKSGWNRRFQSSDSSASSSESKDTVIHIVNRPQRLSESEI